MPIYDYACDACDFEEEQISSIARRDNLRPCKKCGGSLHRVQQISEIAEVRRDTMYQCSAILENGQKVEGSFGTRRKKRTALFNGRAPDQRDKDKARWKTWKSTAPKKKKTS